MKALLNHPNDYFLFRTIYLSRHEKRYTNYFSEGIIYTKFKILKTKLTISRGGSRTAATSKMERFMIIVHSWKRLNIITKRSIVDVAAALDPPLISQQFTNFSSAFEKVDFSMGYIKWWWSLTPVQPGFECLN